MFDGNDAVVPFLGYAGTADTKKVVEAMQKFRPRSRNANLNGAVYQGLHSLRDRLKDATAAQKSAILVIFTDRGELAHSVSPETLKQGLKETPAQVYVIGVGEGVHRDELTALGRSGTYLSSNPKNFKDGFAEIGAEADRRRRRTLRVLLLLAQAPRQPQGRGRGRHPEGPRPPHVQVQRRRLHGGLHAPRSRSTWPRRPPTRRRKAATSAKTRADASLRAGRLLRSLSRPPLNGSIVSPTTNMAFLTSDRLAWRRSSDS